MYIPVGFFNTEEGEGRIEATGGIIYDIHSGSFVWRLHEFETVDNTTTTDYNFIVSSGSTSQARILVVAAGGQGSTIGIANNRPNQPAGGGGGGVLLSNSQTITTGSYSVRVGGAPALTSNTAGLSGANSYFQGNGINVTSTGGGGAGYYLVDGCCPSVIINGKNGGSGGGAEFGVTYGSGITGQGFRGGSAALYSNVYYGGGGGGAGQIGGNAPGNASIGGKGGDGKQLRLSPYMTLDWYSGGAGGGGSANSGNAGSGSNQTPYARNNMGDRNTYGGGSVSTGLSSYRGIVRIMYPLYRYNPADTQTYQFTCTDSNGCAIQYVNPNGTLVDGELLAYTATISKVVPRNSQARITDVTDGTTGGTITKFG